MDNLQGYTTHVGQPEIMDYARWSVVISFWKQSESGPI